MMCFFFFLLLFLLLVLLLVCRRGTACRGPGAVYCAAATHGQRAEGCGRFRAKSTNLDDIP